MGRSEMHFVVEDGDIVEPTIMTGTPLEMTAMLAYAVHLFLTNIEDPDWESTACRLIREELDANVEARRNRILGNLFYTVVFVFAIFGAVCFVGLIKGWWVR